MDTTALYEAQRHKQHVFATTLAWWTGNFCGSIAWWQSRFSVFNVLSARSRETLGSLEKPHSADALNLLSNSQTKFQMNLDWWQNFLEHVPNKVLHCFLCLTRFWVQVMQRSMKILWHKVVEICSDKGWRHFHPIAALVLLLHSNSCAHAHTHTHSPSKQYARTTYILEPVHA